jgi:hypothetical protein
MKRIRYATLILFAAAASAPFSFAQLGPWTDGEIVVFTPSVAGSGPTLFRVAPESGFGAVLATPNGVGGWSGRATFDSYRSRLLIYMSLPPDPPSMNKLWSLDWNGSATAIPGFTNAPVRALASVGDGRVYFQDHVTTIGAPHHIRYLDASDAVQTLMDSTNAAPFSFEVERMIYHAASNALIATTSVYWSANSCAASGSSVFRIPLSADGAHVAGPVTCASIDAPYSPDIMGLDFLPDGNVLLTLSTGNSLGGVKLISVDPVSLATSVWADPFLFDVNGGCYSVRVGKAVVLDDASNQLRAFSMGETGAGTTIPSTVPVGDFTTGQYPPETMWEIDTNGPSCFGSAVPFGIGLAGFSGFVPTLGVTGCPDVGQFFTIAMDGVVGGAAGLLVAGPTPSFLPIAGGFLYVDPIVLMLDVFASGAPGAAGAGSVGLPVFTTDPALKGLVLYLQAGFVDPAAVQGVSLSNGLALILG